MKQTKRTKRTVAASISATIVAIIIILTLTAGAAPTAGTSDVTLPSHQEEPKTEGLDPAEVTLIAKTIWGEARGVESYAEKAAVAWCILNRVDAEEFPDTIAEVVTEPMQFVGYCEDNPVEPELTTIARDVLSRWKIEKINGYVSGRTLPAEYKFMWGDGEHNHFTIEWLGDDEWNWSLPSPYSAK